MSAFEEGSEVSARPLLVVDSEEISSPSRVDDDLIGEKSPEGSGPKHMILVFPNSKKRAKEFLRKSILPSRDNGDFALVDAVVVKISNKALSDKPKLTFKSLFDVEINRLRHAAKTAFGTSALIGVLTPFLWPIVATTGTVAGVLAAHQERQGESEDLAELYKSTLLEILQANHFSDQGSCVLLFWERPKRPLALANALLGCGGIIVHTQRISPERAKHLQALLDGDETAIDKLKAEMEALRAANNAPRTTSDPNSIAARMGYIKKM